MTRRYRLRGLDCPDCAGKLENALRRTPGLGDSRIHFASLSLELNPAYLAQARQVIRREAPSVAVLLPNQDQVADLREDRLRRGVRIGIAALLLLLGLLFRDALHTTPYHLGEVLVFGAAYLVVGGKVLAAAAGDLLRGQPTSEKVLMAIATLGAFVVHEMPEAVAVMLFYTIGESLESIAVARSRRSIANLVKLRPDGANWLRGDEVVRVKAESVPLGATLLVKPGERVPLDGLVREGSSLLDASALTGESLPKSAQVGDTVLAGMVNGQGLLRIETTRRYADTSLAKILALVEEAADHKAPSERFITRFARIYTPLVILAAALFAILPPLLIPGEAFSQWAYRALILLVISCPCALVLSVPLGYFGGLGGASRAGILVKGANFLEAMATPRVVAFDKTGTLTQGSFQLQRVEVAGSFQPEQVLRLAALAESHSTHPIARAIFQAWGGSPKPGNVEEVKEEGGFGVAARVLGREVLVGSKALLTRDGITGFAPPRFHENGEDAELAGKGGKAQGFPISGEGLPVWVAVDGEPAGCLWLADQLKPDAVSAVQALRRLGVRQLALLSGDASPATEEVGRRLGIDRIYAGLLPEEKVRCVETLKTEGKGAVLFVGDGINDAPVLARADVGIAMGGLGSDVAIEAADVVIMDDRPSQVVEAIRLARRTRGIIIQNIILALGVKAVFLVMGLFGVATMWEAVIADIGVTLLAVLNSARALQGPRRHHSREPAESGKQAVLPSVGS